MVLVSLKDKGIDGARVEAVCEKINIALNKNSIPGDKSALVPGGVRIGAPAMTTRGASEEDFVKIANYIDATVKYAKKVQSELPIEANKLKDFKKKIAEGSPELASLKTEVYAWAGDFPLST